MHMQSCKLKYALHDAVQTKTNYKQKQTNK